MNVGNITIAKQGDAGAMFLNCSNLTAIGNITGVNITKARQMFQNCQSLATVEALERTVLQRYLQPIQLLRKRKQFRPRLLLRA